jgi:hypothetical protein
MLGRCQRISQVRRRAGGRGPCSSVFAATDTPARVVSCNVSSSLCYCMFDAELARHSASPPSFRIGSGFLFKTRSKPVKAIGQSAKLIGAAEVVLKPGCYAAQPLARHCGNTPHGLEASCRPPRAPVVKRVQTTLNRKRSPATDGSRRSAWKRGHPRRAAPPELRRPGRRGGRGARRPLRPACPAPAASIGGCRAREAPL